MAPSGEHRPEDLGQAPIRAASIAVGNAAATLRQQVKNLDSHASGQTVAKQCEILTAQAGIAEKVSSNLAIVAAALGIREEAAKAWNRNAPKDSEIAAAETAVADAKKKLQDASTASGDTSAASTELENAQKHLGDLRRRRREADKAYGKAEQRAEAKLAEITLTNSSTGNGTEGGAPTAGATSPGTGTGSPATGTGKPAPSTSNGKTTTGTGKPSSTPAATLAAAKPADTETSTATPESTAALAALLASQQQQPAAQAQAQPTAATPTAATPTAAVPQQPEKKDTPQSKSSPLDSILGSDGVFGLDDAARALGPTAVALGGTPASTTSSHNTPAAATPSAPASSAPSATGLSAGTVTQPTTSGTSAQGLTTATDVTGRPAEQQRSAFSPGPETKTSSATGTSSAAAPAHAAGTRPVGGGMPMMGPMGGMAPMGGAGKGDRDKELTTSATGSEESYLLHGRHAVDEAVPGGTIAQKDHPRRRPPESDAA
ncbi:hypothetical protein ACP6C7_03860 [Mycolicibacterium septicum]|uniref:Uncharacterized protein n=1 Tax=Mycolicibacterium septicum TaxID=98668 RepID=A0ABW9LNM9_9MYCO